MKSVGRVRPSLLPDEVPSFLDKSFVTVEGKIILEPEILGTIKGRIGLDGKSLFFLAANLFRANQSFELRLKTSEWGSEFSQISLPRQKRPNPPTRINAWWPTYGKDGNNDNYDDQFLAYTFATMLVKAFRRPESENPFKGDGIKVLCHALKPIERLSVDVKVGIRKCLLDKYPKLLP